MIILFCSFVLKRSRREEIGIAGPGYCYTFRFKLGAFLEFTPMTCRRAAGEGSPSSKPGLQVRID